MRKMFRFFSIILLLQFLYCNTVDVIFELQNSNTKNLHLNFSNKFHVKTKTIVNIQSDELLTTDTIQNTDDQEFDYETAFLFVDAIIYLCQDVEEIYTFNYFPNNEKMNSQFKEFLFEDLYIKNSSIPPEYSIL